jgi:hypothetical protein
MPTLRLTSAILMTLFALPGQANQPFFSRTLFDGTATVHSAKGRGKQLHVSIRRFELDADEDGAQKMSVPNFSVMTLCGGRVATTISGYTTIRETGDFWTVRPGSVIEVRVLGESAILQALIVSP